MMILDLHGQNIALSCADLRVQQQWRQLFAFELATPSANKQATALLVHILITENKPELPQGQPFYSSQFPPLKVFASRAGEISLVPTNEVLIRLNFGAQPATEPIPDIMITMTPFVLESDSFEDVITLALAPMLRRRDLFMIHAFTAAHQGQAVMFVGASGSGKTSSGLALVSGGWEILANDIALLSENGVINALLSPGTVHATPQTLALLPDMEARFQHITKHPYHGKVAIPRQDLLKLPNPLQTAPISAIYFPEVGTGPNHQISALHPAVGLARLMEASIDQWDKPTWLSHVDFLDRLSQQVRFRKLTLGSNLATLSNVLDEKLDSLAR